MEFTYKEYNDILTKLAEKGFAFTKYYNHEESEKSVILRHDVDVSIYDAERIAKLEVAFDKSCRSTFFVLLSSDFYNVFSKGSLHAIDNMLNMGHSIGLHFDETKYFAEGEWNEEDLSGLILKEKRILEEIIGVKVSAVSMHRPSRRTLESNVNIPGTINTYSEFFFNDLKYVSDSYHRWREDIYSIIDSEKYTKLHLLTHPFWYHDDNLSRRQTFEKYINEGCEYRRYLIENNLLPPNVTFEESIKEDE